MTIIFGLEDHLLELNIREKLSRKIELFDFISAASHKTLVKSLERINDFFIFLDKTFYLHLSQSDLLSFISNDRIILFSEDTNDAVLAFEQGMAHFVQTPLETENLDYQLNIIINRIEKINTFYNEKSILEQNLFLRNGNKSYLVKLKDIYLIESIGNYVKFYFQNSSCVVHRTLKDIEQRFLTPDLFRANRKEIVNLNFIQNTSIDDKGTIKLLLSSGRIIEISSRNAQNFKKTYSI